MTDWQGKVTVSSKVGAPVVIDEWTFPRRVTFNFEGEGLSPDLTGHFEIKDDKPQCVELSVRAKEDGRGLTDADLRLFSIESLTNRVFATAAGQPLHYGGHSHPVAPEHIPEAAEVVAGAQSKDERLAMVARTYLSDTHGAPVKAVELKHDMPRSTALRWIKRARDAHLIPDKRASASELADALTALTPVAGRPDSMSIEEFDARMEQKRRGSDV